MSICYVKLYFIHQHKLRNVLEMYYQERNELDTRNKYMTHSLQVFCIFIETKEAVKGSFCLTESKDLSQINQFRELVSSGIV